jgi:hypothetical protein
MRSFVLILQRVAVLLILTGVVAITAVGCGGDAANPKVEGSVPALKPMLPKGGGSAAPGQGSQ